MANMADSFKRANAITEVATELNSHDASEAPTQAPEPEATFGKVVLTKDNPTITLKLSDVGSIQIVSDQAPGYPTLHRQFQVVSKNDWNTYIKPKGSADIATAHAFVDRENPETHYKGLRENETIKLTGGEPRLKLLKLPLSLPETLQITSKNGELIITRGEKALGDVVIEDRALMFKKDLEIEAAQVQLKGNILAYQTYADGRDSRDGETLAGIERRLNAIKAFRCF